MRLNLPSSPKPSSTQLFSIFSNLNNLSDQLCCPLLSSLTPSLPSINTLIQTIRHQILVKDTSLLNSFQNIIHLLDSCSLMSKVTKTNDKKLFEKAFSYFNESLTHLVKTLHEYPINLQYSEKKIVLEKRHLLILQQAQENSVESSILEDNTNSQVDNQRLFIENEQLVRRNEELELVLTTMEKEVVQTELRMMNMLNDQKEKETGRGSIGGSSKVLRGELEAAKREMEEMNQEFTIQIKKYNQVFRSMEKEIDHLSQKGYVEGENEIIEELETHIIKLRQQRQRDDMIIRQLRDHLARYKSYYKNHSRAPTNRYY